jgi:hypothetical protein
MAQPSIYVRVMRDGILDEDFTNVSNVSFSGNVDALKVSIRTARGTSLAGVEPWQMAVFGPWGPTSEGVPDVSEAMSGKGRSPNTALSSLVRVTGDLFFLVRVTTPACEPAAVAGALEWARFFCAVAQRQCRCSHAPSCL